MPYSGANDPGLPNHIKKMPEAVRNTWSGAWNGAMDNCRSKGSADCEGYAFRVANAAITKERSMNIKAAFLRFARLTGGTVDEKAASLTDQVENVRQAVHQRFTPPPMPMMAEGGHDCYIEDVLADSVIFEMDDQYYRIGYTVAADGTVTLDSGDPVPVAVQYVPKEADATTDPAPMLAITKDANGRYRWLAVMSNKFQDVDGDILEEAAHKEFEAAIDSGEAPMPELWFWHIPGTKMGKADFLTYTTGFVLASGQFDDESYGEKLAGMKDLGVSHGFRGTKEGAVFTKYRTHEISPLPLSAAANKWTAFQLEAPVTEIPANKLAALKELFPPEHVAGILAFAGQAEKQLEAAGVASKEAETPTVDTTAIVAAIKESAAQQMDAFTKALDATKAETTAQIGTVQKSIDELAGRVTTLEGKKANVDAEIAAMILPRNASAAGYRPTQAQDNAPTEAQKQAMAEGKDWMGEIFAPFNSGMGVA